MRSPGCRSEAREVAEASIGGVLGFVEQAKGTLPQEQLDGLVSIAKNAFVDGLTAAAIVGAVVVALAAVAVKRYLPNDHNTAATRDPVRRRHARRRRLSSTRVGGRRRAAAGRSVSPPTVLDDLCGDTEPESAAAALVRSSVESGLGPRPKRRFPFRRRPTLMGLCQHLAQIQGRMSAT